MIYADHAATTAVSKRAFSVSLPFLQGAYGNASSVYAFGKRVRKAVEQARQQVADAVGAAASEIVFTAGGSEGNNTILRGVAERAWREGRRVHIVVSAIEHSSVLAPCMALEKLGARIDYLPVSQDGRVSAESVAAALSEETCLVSIMLANNEVGTVQDITAIAELLKERGVPLHTDAVQAVGHIPVDAKALGVTYLTASGHKFGGMKGTGFLWQKKGWELPPLLAGGGQERGRRAGTENTAGIVALGEALEESVERMQAEAVRLQGLVAYTLQMIQREVPEVRVHSVGAERLPTLLNIGIPGVRGESLVHLLDLKGICVSAASACSAGTDAPSHVLVAMGYGARDAMEALRISYGRENTQEDAERIAVELARAVRKMRALGRGEEQLGSTASP